MLQTLPYFTQLLTMNTTQSQYELFQEWLDNCPVKMIDYQDFTDQFKITFEVELEEEEV